MTQEYNMLVLLIVEVVVLIAIDQKIWGTYFTPITFLSVPFVIVLVGALLFAEPLGFVAVHYKAIVVWIIGLFVFWLPGFFIGSAKVKLDGGFRKLVFSFPIKIYNLRILDWVTFILLVVVLLRVFILIPIYGLGTDDFSVEFGKGLPAHCAFALRFILICYMGIIKKNNVVRWLLIVLIVLMSVLYGAKSWILIPVIAGVVVRYMTDKQRMNVSLKMLIVTGLSVFLVFFLTYYWTVAKRMDGGMAQYIPFLLNHIAKYFFAGLLSFSEYLRVGGDIGLDPNYIYVTPINLYNFLLGKNMLLTNSDLWNFISNHGDYVNVKTFMGTPYIYGGIVYGAIAIFAFGSIHYYFLFLSIVKKNIVLLSIYAFFLSMLIFGWFDPFFLLLAFYEVPIVGLFIYIFTKKRLKLYSTDE